MKKIMFNDQYGLTKAVLDEAKTMTRRIAYGGEISKPNFGICLEGKDKGKAYLCDGECVTAKSKYAIGEVVAVAQSYKNIAGSRTWINSEHMGISAKYAMSLKGWENKMFVKSSLMPRRIKITDIKVERLQDISDEDCLKEGIIKNESGFPDVFYFFDNAQSLWNGFPSASEAYSILIDKVSGKGTWERNPWVFAYSFNLVK